jgi:hypothetical protein
MGSESDRDRYKKVLDDVRLKKRDLISRFQESYKELEAIERFAAERAGEVMSGDGFKADGFFRAQAEIGTATDPQATEWALKEIGNPATVPEIVDVLLAHGFGTDRSRDRLSNAVLIAMKRNAPFKKISRGLWALAEWDRKR